MDIAELHHVTIPCSDIERSAAFYRNVFGLNDIRRPTNRRTTGAWFSVGRQQLHLVRNENATYRQSSAIDQDDAHFALRVSNFDGALERLREHGFRDDAALDDPMRIEITHHRGFPQAYVLDPDRNIVEINGWIDKQP
ncbi:MAG: VOC family protein [Microvirga sp.]